MNTFNSFAIENHLKKRGFTLSGEDARAYVRGLRHPAIEEPIYVKVRRSKGRPAAVSRLPVVLHPEAGLPLKALAAIGGVAMADALYHNSNLAGFPKRDNGGKKEIEFGRAFQFADHAALDAFVDHLTGLRK
jgi:hypothetical protein